MYSLIVTSFVSLLVYKANSKETAKKFQSSYVESVPVIASGAVQSLLNSGGDRFACGSR
jgi:hypothetical protein